MKNEGLMELNLKKSLNLIHEASENEADLILFPEVQLTEFFPQYQRKDVSNYAVELDSNIVSSFRKACKENQIIAVPNLYLLESGKTFDANGKTIKQVDDTEQTLYVDLDLEQSKQIRNKRSYTNLRKTEWYR